MKGTPEMPQCGFSRAVVQVLDLHDVLAKTKTYNVLADEELRNSIKEYRSESNDFCAICHLLNCHLCDSSWPTIPQLYVKGEFLGGCDILLGMHQSGELEKVSKRYGSQDLSDCLLLDHRLSRMLGSHRPLHPSLQLSNSRYKGLNHPYM